MAFNKKTWTDRVAEFINRRSITHEDGSEELVTVARSEGTVSQEGDAFNAATMNDLEERIENEFESINSKLENSRKLLWSGSSTTMAENFEITLASSDYDELEVVFKPFLNANYMNVVRTVKGGDVALFWINTSNGNSPYCQIRSLHRIDDVTYRSSAGTYQYTNTTSRNNDVKLCVPHAIYGIKYYS